MHVSFNLKLNIHRKIIKQLYIPDGVRKKALSGVRRGGVTQHDVMMVMGASRTSHRACFTRTWPLVAK